VLSVYDWLFFAISSLCAGGIAYLMAELHEVQRAAKLAQYAERIERLEAYCELEQSIPEKMPQKY